MSSQDVVRYLRNYIASIESLQNKISQEHPEVSKDLSHSMSPGPQSEEVSMEELQSLNRKFKESVWNYNNPFLPFMKEDEFLSLYQRTKMSGLLVMAYVCKLARKQLTDKDLEHEGLSPYYRSFFQKIMKTRNQEDLKSLAFELIDNSDERTDFTDDLFLFLVAFCRGQ